jgi:16S rRNA (guanine(1405)-N(7))-methyltransferase
MDKLKQKILDKKELHGLTPGFLDAFLEEYIKKNTKSFKILQEKNYNEKSKEFDELKKYVRKRLREVHGVFVKDRLPEEKRVSFLQAIKTAPLEKEIEILKKVLASHQSTIERLESYSELYGLLFKEKKPKKILDLGCGYNPFSYKFLGCAPEYVAVDINEEDSAFIKSYFQHKKIKGETLTLDLTEDSCLKLITKISKNSDFCFLFKLLDSLEAKKRGSSKNLVKHLNSRVLVVSFPLKTIGGRNNITGKRKWFEKIIKEGNYESEELILGSEKYYVLKHKNLKEKNSTIAQ